MSKRHLSHLTQLQTIRRENIGNLKYQQEFNDITFIVGENEKEFKANRMLFASISPAFRAMLYGNMKESAPNATIKIPDIESNGFECVLNYVYCADPKLDHHNIISVKLIADKYQIEALSTFCDEKFAEFCQKKEYYLLLLNSAVNFRIEKFVKLCTDTMRIQLGESATSYFESNFIKQCSIECIKVLLQIDTMDISEEEIWVAVVKWAEYQSSLSKCKDFDGSEPMNKRRKLHHNHNNEEDEDHDKNNKKLNLLKELSPFIRYGLMSGRYFVKEVQPYNILSNKETQTISNYILCGQDINENCAGFSTKRRCFEICIERSNHIDKVNGMLLIGDSNAITIESNEDTYLKGIDIFVCKGAVKCSLEIYKAREWFQDDDGNKNVIYTDHIQLYLYDATLQTYKWMFKDRFPIEKNTKYTIDIGQVNRDYSAKVVQGRKMVETNGLRITFSNAYNSDQTNIHTGAFPRLYFSS